MYREGSDQEVFEREQEVIHAAKRFFEAAYVNKDPNANIAFIDLHIALSVLFSDVDIKIDPSAYDA